MNYLGIDPGAYGALALLNNEGALIALHDAPYSVTYGKRKRSSMDIEACSILFRDVSIKHGLYMTDVLTAIEHVHAMPSVGSVATCSLCGSSYAWQAFLAMYSYPCKQVPPQTWKKHFNLLKKPKFSSRVLVHELYPDADVFRPDNEGSVDRADAILIARWLHENSCN